MVFFPWNLKSPVYIAMGSHVFSAQIRAILNRVILKTPKHLALFLFFLSSLNYLLSASWVYSSNHIHMNHLEREQWCFYPRWVLFPPNIQQPLLGHLLFHAPPGAFMSIIAFNFVLLSHCSWEAEINVFIWQKKIKRWKESVCPKVM